eukprot:scaffold805_cov110-Isochrysis_galbana.AAC.10
MRLLLAKDRHSTLDHQGSNRKCFIQSQIRLKQNSTANLRRVLRTLHPAEHPRGDLVDLGADTADTFIRHMLSLAGRWHRRWTALSHIRH